MKLYPNQLEQHCQSPLAPIYCVSGDEPLLVQEACDCIRQAAVAQGFNERIRHAVDAKFDWQQLQDSAQSLSLFSEQQLIELHFDTVKFSDKAKALLSYCEQPAEDTVLLIIMPKLDAAQKRTKWYKTLEAAAVTVTIWPLEKNQLPNWLSNRARQLGLSLQADAVAALAERVEGNLLAGVQSLEKLALSHQGTAISRDELIEATHDSSRYDVFKLIDSAMNKERARVIKILQGLKQEGEEPLKILWALSRQCRLLGSMAFAIGQGDSVANQCKQHRVWDKQKPLVAKALQNRKPAFFHKCLERSQQIDAVIKGCAPGNAWDQLLTLFLVLAK